MTHSREYPPAVFLMGPTASGKSNLALELVERLPLEIVSVDSALVYRGMDIGTAKPDAQTLRRIPHHLVDILDPVESYSAARFRADALGCMERIQAGGRVPLLVGGTMLYFRALQRGLSALPGADRAVREEIEFEAGRRGWPALHADLAAVDPDAAARIHRNDPQRIQRALEVYRLAGRPMTELYRAAAAEVLPYRVLKLMIAPRERGLLHQAIELRFRGMLEQGLLEEVGRLFARGDLGLDKPAIRAVGYRQVWEHLEGRYGHEEMVLRAIVATRQLAKRQFTWLRSETDTIWLDSTRKDVVAQALKYVRPVAIN